MIGESGDMRRGGQWMRICLVSFHCWYIECFNPATFHGTSTRSRTFTISHTFKVIPIDIPLVWTYISSAQARVDIPVKVPLAALAFSFREIPLLIIVRHLIVVRTSDTWPSPIGKPFSMSQLGPCSSASVCSSPSRKTSYSILPWSCTIRVDKCTMRVDDWPACSMALVLRKQLRL